MNDFSGSNSLYIGAKSVLTNKYEVRIEDCVPGMEIAETINNNLGASIISERTLLEAPMIKILKKLGIKKIKVYESHSNCISDPAQIFKQKYLDNLTVVKDLIHDLYSNKPLDAVKVDVVANSLSENINEGGGLLKNINYTYKPDDYIYTHCLNVSIISMLIAKWLNYSENDIKLVVKAGLLHDIGKAKIQNSILNKPGPLSPKEFSQIKLHGNYGYEMVTNIANMNSDIGMGVLMHHEREDGSGYGSGLKSGEIHEFAKILAVADVFDAMSSDKVYSKKKHPFYIFNQMETNNIGSLSKKITMSFLDHAPNFFIGERFFMNNGETAEIIFINPQRIAKPLIKVGERYIDLAKEPELELLNII